MRRSRRHAGRCATIGAVQTRNLIATALLLILGCAAVLCRAAVAPEWFSAFTQRVAQEGKDATLPPHLALALGLGDGEHSLPVKQAGLRSGAVVRTFNVAHTASHPTVVLLEHHEDTQLTRAFLLKNSAQLAKALAYSSGAEPQAIPASQARPQLQEQLKYWSEQTKPPSPAQ